jgi:ubiquinone biosynthesis monooxygenase Coq7
MPTPDTLSRTIRQILRVNYAGEYAAIRIYGAQIAVSRFLAPGILDFLDHTIAHERRHAAQFLALMPARATRPCGATFLWGVGGSMLGFLMGMLGRNGVMICTQAVERTVHAHLNEQITWLGDADPVLLQAIIAIRDEEVGHHDNALARRSCYSMAARFLDGTVALATNLLIWFSTYGVSTRIKLSA